MTKWKPPGWFLITDGPVRDSMGELCYRGEVSCDGSPQLPIFSPGKVRREAEKRAWRTMFNWIIDHLGQGWTVKTGNRVHLRIKGHGKALCRAAVCDSPNINHKETPQCSKCLNIQKVLQQVTGREI